MDIYILDDQLRRSEVVDDHESFIWSERFAAYGDFELVVRSTRNMRNLFQPGQPIGINQSHRFQFVETVEDTLNDNGEKALKIKGRSAEAMLTQRVTSRLRISAGTAQENYKRTGAPADLIREIFDTFCRTNTYQPGDNIPFITAGTFLPTGAIMEPLDPVTIDWPVGTVYDFIKKLADIYSLGFRLVKKYDESEVYFDVVTGSNRTSGQALLPPVIFAAELDNLSNTTELTTIADNYNVAYVFAKNGSRKVFAGDADDSTAGFDRKVLLVDALDIETAAGTDLETELDQRGREQLSLHRTVFAFDGVIPEFGSYKYGVDYNLGDVVEKRNSDGLSTNMRVTEQIFVSDNEGDRSYPTLAVNLVVTPGSWLSWGSTTFWQDASGTWAEQP